MVAGVTQRTPMAYEPGKHRRPPGPRGRGPECLRGRQDRHGQAARRRALLAAGQARGRRRGPQVRDRARLLQDRQQPVRARLLRRPRRRRAGRRRRARRSPASRRRTSTRSSSSSRAQRGGTLAAALVLPLAAPVPRDYAPPLDREKVSGYGVQAGRDRPVHGRRLRARHEDHARAQPELEREDRLPPRLPRPDRDAAGQRRRRDRLAPRSSTGSSMVSGDYLMPPVGPQGGRHRARRASSTIVDSGGGRWAALNTTVAPFDDVNVRKAVAGRLQPRGGAARARRQARRHRRHPLPAAGHCRASSRPAARRARAWTSSPTPAGDPAVAAAYMKRRATPRAVRGRRDPDGRPGRRQRPPDLRAGQGARSRRSASRSSCACSRSRSCMTKYCGFPAAAVAVCPNVGWTRDFADGQTYLDPTFNGENIHPVGNANVSQLDDPGGQRGDRRRQDRDRPGRACRRRGARSTGRSRRWPRPCRSCGTRPRWPPRPTWPRWPTRTSASGTSPSRLCANCTKSAESGGSDRGWR